METASLEDNQLTALRAQVIGFVFQQFQLLPGTSAIDNVAAPLLYQGVKSKDAKAKAAEVLTQLGLGERLNYDRTKLSGGQQQRVAIARALATDPTIILADEPTGALDSRSGEAVMEIFQNMHKEGKTIVLITHDLEIAAMAERRIHIRDGRIEIDERDQKAAKK
jgi:putative ABC transport system ATP-binding protein